MGYMCLTSLSTKLLLYHDEQYWSQALDTTSIVIHKINRVIVFNTTFNNISVISWWSVLLVEETGVHGEKHGPAPSY